MPRDLALSVDGSAAGPVHVTEEERTAARAGQSTRRSLTSRAPGRRSAPVFSLALFAGIAFAGPSAADDARRSVAVVEHRSGVAGAPDLAERLARRLGGLAALSVTGPAEARRRDATVDSTVAGCAGDTACVAALSLRLDADETLLVAITQLGDLVVTLQRIDAHAARVLTRLSAVLADENLADEQLDRWLKQLYPADVFRRFGRIVIVTADGARVEVDDELRGTTPIEPISVPAPARYRLRLTKPGYLAWNARFDVAPDATVEVRAELAAAPATPWFKRWYVWGAVGVVVAGATVGTAVGLTTRPDDSRSDAFIILPR